MRSDFSLMLSWLEQGEDLAVLTVISRQGSAPRLPGSRMLLTADGRQAGTIGGGSVEAQALHLAREVWQDGLGRVLHFSSGPDRSTEVDMICGGSVDILLEWLPGDDYNIALLRSIKEQQDKGQRGYVITPLPVPGCAAEPRFYLGPDGNVIGTTNLSDNQEMMAAVTDIRTSRIITMEQSSFLVEPCCPSVKLYIFGAGHVARAICPLAMQLGFAVMVVDDRAEYLTRELFPAVHQIVLIHSFQNCLPGLMVDDNSMLLIVTRGHQSDQMVLAQALSTPAFYIGMIGSIRKRDTIYQNLLSQGVCTTAELERVNCPVGLKIGADTPEEIAVSICAQLIQARAVKKRGKIK